MLQCWTDLVPQEAEIWPVGQVHMLGLEQNPSPQVLRQMGTIHWFPPVRVFQPGQQKALFLAPHTLGPLRTSEPPLLLARLALGSGGLATSLSAGVTSSAAPSPPATARGDTNATSSSTASCTSRTLLALSSISSSQMCITPPVSVSPLTTATPTPSAQCYQV